MNRHAKLFLSCIALVFTHAGLLAGENKPIQELNLDEHTVYTIPVSSSRVTTVSFPGPISAIDAALVTVDGKTAGLFQLAHQPGSYFFSVRSLVKDATTNVNVRWNNKTYVLELQDSKTPLLSLIFKYQPDTGKSSFAQRVVTPGMLVGQAMADPDVEKKVKAYFRDNPASNRDAVHVAAVACRFRREKVLAGKPKRQKTCFQSRPG